MNKLDSHKQVRRVALAYSGGLDTSVMITWLRENYGCEVVAVVGDVGQKEDFDAVCAKALDTGAVACRVVDLKGAFVEECVLPALRAGAIYEGQYLLGTALARPVIARAQVEVARAFGCDAVAHGCTGKGNDQVRFELTYRALAPELEIIAPWREWEITSREDAIAYAEERGIPVPVTVDKPYSIDKNLWHTSFEGGVLENPAVVPPDDLHDLTVDPRSAPKEPYDVVIRFESGIPVALDGEELDPVALIGTLNTLAGSHGVGRIDLVENRLVGMKSRGVYETPAGTVLLAALRDLEAITLDRDTAAFKRTIAARYAVVNADTACSIARFVHGFGSSTGDGRGDGEAVQGVGHAGRTSVVLQPVSRGPRDVQRGCGLRSGRRRRLHPVVGVTDGARLPRDSTGGRAGRRFGGQSGR